MSLCCFFSLSDVSGCVANLGFADVTGMIAYYLGLNASLATDTSAMKKLIVGSALPISIDKTFAKDKDPSILINNGILVQTTE